MQQPDIVADYLDALGRELRFDAPLSRRVLKEAEDHLWESAAADPSGISPEAVQRAINEFGAPREIARQYATVSLSRQTRWVGAIVTVALASVFAAMKGRLAWYGYMHWELNDRWNVIGLIDRYTFLAALVFGAASVAYISSRRTPIVFSEAYREQVKRCAVVSAVTAVAAGCFRWR